jgi:asparagine synthase (glutamine-hydrolysing)
MRNQLLRDTDWAGMAHGVEVRVPLVDFKLLKFLTPSIHMLRPGMGKAALAIVPSIPLPAENIDRAKTGFSVPIGAWMRTAVTANSGRMGHARESKGLISRAWSRSVLNNWAPVNWRGEAQPA